MQINGPGIWFESSWDIKLTKICGGGAAGCPPPISAGAPESTGIAAQDLVNLLNEILVWPISSESWLNGHAWYLILIILSLSPTTKGYLVWIWWGFRIKYDLAVIPWTRKRNLANEDGVVTPVRLQGHGGALHLPWLTERNKTFKLTIKKVKKVWGWFWDRFYIGTWGQ